MLKWISFSIWKLFVKFSFAKKIDLMNNFYNYNELTYLKDNYFSKNILFDSSLLSDYLRIHYFRTADGVCVLGNLRKDIVDYLLNNLDFDLVKYFKNDYSISDLNKILAFKINFQIISLFQNLNEDFLSENFENINLKLLCRNKNISKKLKIIIDIIE